MAVSHRLSDWAVLCSSVLWTALAGLLLLVCLQDWPAIPVRAEFEALPDYDYRTQGEQLLAEERFSEALLVVEAGLEAQPERQVELQELKSRIETQRDSWMRRLQAAGKGALSGRGNSVESLSGAVVADLFVFGDVRDLVIQGGHALRGEETDDVIVALSAAGIVLTVTPELDLGAALLKFARKVGALSDTLAKNLVKLARRAVDEKSTAELTQAVDDVAVLGRSARPGGAMAILKNVDDPGELHLAAQFAQREGGAFALWVGGKGSLSWLKSAGKEGEELLLRASRKGRAGLDFLAGNSRLLLLPHPLIGLLKGLYKGNIPALLAQVLQSYAEVLLGFVAGWFGFELGLLAWRIHRQRRTVTIRDTVRI